MRQTLGAYLFGGKDAAKKVSSLSGGEKSRLVLAELLQSRPNFLILDEPTNHMDVAAKETLESAFRAYTGTILFVSHDRYFLKQVAESVMMSITWKKRKSRGSTRAWRRRSKPKSRR